MTHSITNTIRAIANLLQRDVRDLFKAQGKLVNNEFLNELRNSLHEAGVGQNTTEQMVADVDSAWHGRIVPMEQVVELLKMRLREALG